MTRPAREKRKPLPKASVSWSKKAAHFWLAPQDALTLRVFECLFTLTFLIWMGRCFMTWEEWLTDKGFHLSAEELRSMGYPEPWPLLQPWQVPLFALAIFGSGTLLLLNRWRRFALWGLFLTAIYAQRVDFMAAFTLNKLYVGVYGLMAFAPGMYRDAQSGRLMQSAVLLRTLQATLILQYFAAGLAKMDGDWLKGHDILWGHVQGVYRTEAAAFALRNLPMWAWAVQQHIALVFEVVAPVLFMVCRLRPIAFVVGIGMHLMIAVMMKDLIFFSLQMWTFYALFVKPEEWRHLSVKAHQIFFRSSTSNTGAANG
jgi:hypothetical protein